MWGGVKIFKPESGVKFFIHDFFIHEILEGVNVPSGMFNLVPHVKFHISNMNWCE